MSEPQSVEPKAYSLLSVVIVVSPVLSQTLPRWKLRMSLKILTRTSYNVLLVFPFQQRDDGSKFCSPVRGVPLQRCKARYTLTFLTYDTGIFWGVVDDGNGDVVTLAALIRHCAFERYLVAVSFTISQQAPMYSDNYRR